MIVNVAGIVEVGGNRSSLTPISSRTPLSLIRGDDHTIYLTITRSDGTEQTPTDRLVWLYVKSCIERVPEEFKISGAYSAPIGAWVIAIPAATTLRSATGTYLYEIRCITYSRGVVTGTETVVPLSEFRLLDSVRE